METLKVAISVFAAVVSLVALFNSYKFAKEGVRRAQVNAAIAGFNAKASFRKNLFDWAGAVQDTLCEAHEVVARSSDAATCRSQIETNLAKLTSLIDRGRWLLPNENHEAYGVNKESAYTGTRQESLEALVLVYDAYSSFLLGKREKEPLIKFSWQVRRHFTSVIQQKLEPRVLETELEQLYRLAKS